MWILSIALPFRAISLQTDGFRLQLLVIVVRNIRILMFLYLNLSLFYFGTTMVTEPHVMAFLWLPEGPTPHLPACFREALSLSLLSGFPVSDNWAAWPLGDQTWSLSCWLCLRLHIPRDRAPATIHPTVTPDRLLSLTGFSLSSVSVLNPPSLPGDDFYYSKLIDSPLC